MAGTLLPSKISDKNSWPETEDNSSSRGGSHRWPEWDARESLKCKDSSEWPSWKCSQGNKDIQKGDTMDPEMLTIADSSFNEQRGRGRLTESSRDRGWNGISNRSSQMSKTNYWHVTKDHSSSHNGRSHRRPDWVHKDDSVDREVQTRSDYTFDSKISDKNSSPVMKDHSSSRNGSHRWLDRDAHESLKCKDRSEWPSRECSQENKDIQKGDTMDTKMLAIADSSFDEQRGKGRLTESNGDRGWNGISKRPSQMNKINTWPDQDARNSLKCTDNSRWPSWECFEGNKKTHKDDNVDKEVQTHSYYTFDSKISDKNSLPVTEDYSSFQDGSHRWPDWDACESLKCKDSSEWPSWECFKGNKDIQKGDTMDTEILTIADSSIDEQRGKGRLTESNRWPDWDARKSLKCKDSSEWPSWECSQGNKDIQKGDTMDTKMLTIADSSFDEQRGKDRLTESNRDRGWNGILKQPSQMTKKNSGNVRKDHSSSHNGCSRRWPDRDTRNSSKCNKNSRWPSWGCFEGNKKTHKDDTVDREVHTLSDYTFDGQRSQHNIRKWGRARSRSRQREYSKSRSRSRSPCSGLRQASYRLIEKGSVLEMTPRRCRDFAAGKCSRGCQCRFLHQGYLRSRDRDHPKDEVTERSKFRTDERGSLQCGDYKGSAGSPCDNISDSCGDYCEEVESRKNILCCKKLLKRKCFSEDNDSRNEGEVYDQNVKPLVNQNDMDQCKYFSIVDAAKTKECDEDCSLDTPKAKFSGRGEDRKPLEDKFPGVSERPKDTTGRGNWPAWPDRCIGNSNSHDSQSKRWDGRYNGNIDSQDLSEVKEQIDNNIHQNPVKKSGERNDSGSNEKLSQRGECLPVKEQIDNNIHHNPVKKSGERNDSGSNEKLSQRGECLPSHRHNSGNGAACTTKLMNLNMSVDREKAMGQGKDKTKSWNGPTCNEDFSLDKRKSKEKLSGWGEKTKKSEKGSTWDKFAGVSKRPKDNTSWDKWPAWPDNSTGNSSSHDPQIKWLDGISKGNIYCHNLIDATKQADNISSERDDPERREKFSEGEESLQSDFCNGAACNTNMDSKMLVDKEKAMGRNKDMTKSLNSPTWGDEGCSLNRPKDTGRNGRTIGNRDPRVFADVKKRNDGNVAHNFVQKDMTKSWNRQTWGDEGCSLDRPNATRRGGREIGNRDRVLAVIEKRNDGNISLSFLQKGIPNSGSGWSEKVTVRDANCLSPLQDDFNGIGTSTIKVSDSVRLDDEKKPTNQGGDKKNSWNPICGDSACFLDNPKASGWGGGRFSNDRHCHDPVDAEKPSQNNLVKTYCEMAISGQDNKVVGKDEYLLSHMPNGRKSVDKGISNLLSSRKILYRKENQIEAQGSEPGGFVFPPSNLMGYSQSCHALSTNPSNGFTVIVDEPVKCKLSALVNQMQNQFEEALKILEVWARSNSITSDQDLRLSNLKAYLPLISENGQQNTIGNTSGMQLKSDEVCKKLKMEHLESSATILKQQEPVVYTKVNQKTVMVENANGNNSQGEQCKQGEEIIQSIGVDARCEAGESNHDEKSMRLFKNALVNLVKEILNPIWMEGQMKKEVHNAIVKKVAEKVISTEGVNIPKTQEHIEQYLSFSKPQISALINDYVAYLERLEKTSVSQSIALSDNH